MGYTALNRQRTSTRARKRRRRTYTKYYTHPPCTTHDLAHTPSTPLLSFSLLLSHSLSVSLILSPSLSFSLLLPHPTCSHALAAPTVDCSAPTDSYVFVRKSCSYVAIPSPALALLKMWAKNRASVEAATLDLSSMILSGREGDVRGV